MTCRPEENFFLDSSPREDFLLAAVPVHPVGVYFSPDTRNIYADEFIRSYRGILILLMQKHWEFQVVTPRTLANFKARLWFFPMSVF